MSEQTEIFRDLNDHFKKVRHEEGEKNSHTIKKWCQDNHVQVTEIATYHLRICFNGLRMDIYPKSKKYHNLTIGKRGRINQSIVSFIENFFKTK